ncbi:MAG: hypothetical protein G3I10_09165 [Ferrovum sp.]|nr:hypothetical protein [Ferrovum sp.]
MLNQSAAFRDTYDTAFQVSPIILNNGIAAGTLGGMLPIIGLVGQLAGFAQGLLTNGFSMSDFFARFTPVPGSTVISNSVGMYPFANQQVAANAIIEQPLTISLLMNAPVKDAGGYFTKLAIFTALRNSLKSHNEQGGTYHIATPSFVYTNCVMTAMTDVTQGDTKQQQILWQLDFIKPLITLEDASIAYSSLISKLMSGSPVTSPSWSGAAAAVNSPMQGALSDINGMAGAVNNFLSSPL